MFPKVYSLRYSSYYTNLLVNDVFKALPEVSSLFEKVKGIAKYFKQHLVAAAVLKGITGKEYR